MAVLIMAAILGSCRDGAVLFTTYTFPPGARFQSDAAVVSAELDVTAPGKGGFSVPGPRDLTLRVTWTGSAAAKQFSWSYPGPVEIESTGTWIDASTFDLTVTARPPSTDPSAVSLTSTMRFEVGQPPVK